MTRSGSWIRVLFVLAVAALTSMAPGCGPAGARGGVAGRDAAVRLDSGVKIVTILHVNDTHSHLDPWGPKDAVLDGTLGGLTKAAGVIAASTDENTVLVHSGDVFHGDLFFNHFLGVPEFLSPGQLGLAAMVPGNHELDFGPPFLQLSLALTSCGGSFDPCSGGFDVPLVGTNVVPESLASGGESPFDLTPWIKASRITTMQGGVTLGFIGLLNTDDPLQQLASVEVKEPADMMTEIGAAIAALRAAGAQVIVCLSHRGMQEARALAGTSLDIDVIVNGHDDATTFVPEVVNGKIIVSAGAYYRYVGKLELTVGDGAVSVADYQLISVDETVERYPPVTENVVNPLKELVTQAMGFDVYHTALGTAAEPLDVRWNPKNTKRVTALGNFVADAYRAKGESQVADRSPVVALELLGLVDEAAPAGPLVGADVFRMMSYGFDEETRLGFKLTNSTVKGSDVLTILNVAVAGFFPAVAGIRFEYDSTRDPLDQVLPESVRVGNRPLETEGLYTLTTNSFVADNLPTLTSVSPLATVELDGFAYDALVDEVERTVVVTPELEPRIRDAGAEHGMAAVE